MSHRTSENSIVIPLPLSVRLLDPVEIWYRHVRSRRVIYLDTNVWICLTDGRTQAAQECLSICREAVRLGAALFPISFASIGELLRQPQEAPKKLQAALMDELSEGVTFRSAERIQEDEARTAFSLFSSGEYTPLDRSALFTYVVDFLGDQPVTVPAGTTVAQMNALIRCLRSTREIRSVSALLSRADIGKWNNERVDNSFVAAMTETLRSNEERFRSRGRFSAARMRDQERSSLLTSMVVPAFRNIVAEDNPSEDIPSVLNIVTNLIEDFVRRHGGGGPTLMEKILRLMPATELYAQLMAARGMNPDRAVRRQDFWDIEHARIAAAYADAFVTIDRGLIDLLANRSEIPRERNCRVIGTLNDIQTYLRDCLNSHGS